MVRVFQDRQAAKNLTRCQHLPPHRPDHLLETHLVGVGVIALGAGELAEPDGHHLEQAAFDLAGKIGVPLHPADQHYAVAFKGVLVHECLDAVSGRTERYHLQRADDRATHGGLVNAVVRQNVGLAFRGCRAVAPHGWEQEWVNALRFPKVHHGTNDGGDIVYPSASDADGYAASRLQALAEAGRAQLFPDFIGYVIKGAILKMLPDHQQA